MGRPRGVLIVRGERDRTPDLSRIAEERGESVTSIDGADIDAATLQPLLHGQRFDLIIVETSSSHRPGTLPFSVLAEHLSDGGRILVPGDRAATGPALEGAGLQLLETRRETVLTETAALTIARKVPKPGKLTLTVGMLTMDEEESAARMIGEIRRYAPDAEILCVDSSTRDRTPEIARELGARVITQLPPRGHGPAMELLMYTAADQSDLLIYLDCDFTYPPTYIPELRRIVEEEGVDVVNCARTRRKPAEMPWPNFIANYTFAALARAMHGVPTADVHSGMRAFRSSTIRAFDFDGVGDAIPIDTILFPAKCGYRVVEMGIDYAERVGASKLRKVSGSVWTLIRLLRALPVGSRGGRRFDCR